MTDKKLRRILLYYNFYLWNHVNLVKTLIHLIKGSKEKSHEIQRKQNEARVEKDISGRRLL